MTKKKILIALIIILVFICLFSCIGVGLVISNSERIYDFLLSQSSLQVGQVAPNFELTTVDGEKITLSQFRGSTVILTIGATWCPDCQKEAPLLQELHEKNPELKILMVDSKESIDSVIKYKEKFGITYPIVLDPNGVVYNQYRVFAIPTLLLLDENGVIQARIIESVTPETLKNLLRNVNIAQ